MNVTELIFKIARLKPGQRLEYYTGLTGWGLLKENKDIVAHFKTLQETGEYDFVQQNMGYVEHTNYQTFKHFICKRKTKYVPGGSVYND